MQGTYVGVLVTDMPRIYRNRRRNADSSNPFIGALSIILIWFLMMMLVDFTLTMVLQATGGEISSLLRVIIVGASGGAIAALFFAIRRSTHQSREPARQSARQESLEQLTRVSSWEQSMRPHVLDKTLFPAFGQDLRDLEIEDSFEMSLRDGRMLYAYVLRGVSRRTIQPLSKLRPIQYSRPIEHKVVEMDTGVMHGWFLVRHVAARGPRPTPPGGGFRYSTVGQLGEWEAIAETQELLTALVNVHVFERAHNASHPYPCAVVNVGRTMLIYGDAIGDAESVQRSTELLRYLSGIIPPRFA